MIYMMEHTGNGGRRGAAERRTSIRVSITFPAQLSGADAHGQQFNVETRVDNFGAGGLYVRLPLPLKLGTLVLAVIRLTPEQDDGRSVPAIAAQGLVARSEAVADGNWGTALVFTRHSFLYVEDEGAQH